MSSPTQRYQFSPQQDVIEFTAPDFVLVKFGTITTNEDDNTTETRWVKSVFEEIKRHAPHAKLKVLIDFSTIDSGEFNSQESNKIYREMLHDETIAKVAAFGLPHKLKTFATEADTRSWLYAAD